MQEEYSAPQAADAELTYVWLDEAASGTRSSLASNIEHGEVVVCMPKVATAAELSSLLEAGVSARDAQAKRSGRPPVGGRFRSSVSDSVAYSNSVVLSCEEILLRVLDRKPARTQKPWSELWSTERPPADGSPCVRVPRAIGVDEQMPEVYAHLFRPSEAWAERQPLNAQGVQPSVPPPMQLVDACPSLRDLYMAGELEWSEGEPAINVYSAGGGFGTHKDHMALTVLIPLTAPALDFSGGGTGFWSRLDEEMMGGMPSGSPTKVLKPMIGTALLFGGSVAHAGMPVDEGL